MVTWENDEQDEGGMDTPELGSEPVAWLMDRSRGILRRVTAEIRAWYYS